MNQKFLTGVLLTKSQGESKIESGDLTWRPAFVYQRPQNKEIRKQLIKKISIENLN